MRLVAGGTTEVDFSVAAGLPLICNFRMASFAGHSLVFDGVGKFGVGAVPVQTVTASAVNRHGTVLAEAPQFMVFLVTVFASVG
jgi:hypothetical protein